jgi:hypothetical protein
MPPWEKYQAQAADSGPWNKFQSQPATEEEDVPRETSWGESIGRKALHALPVATSIGGGMLGAASPVPGGTIAGGIGGYTAGKNLERMGNEYFFGDKNTGALENLPSDLKEGAVNEALGQIGGLILPTTALKAYTSPMIGKIASKAGELAEGAGGLLDKVARTAVKVPAKAALAYTTAHGDPIRAMFHAVAGHGMGIGKLVNHAVDIPFDVAEWTAKKAAKPVGFLGKKAVDIAMEALNSKYGPEVANALTKLGFGDKATGAINGQ